MPKKALGKGLDSIFTDNSIESGHDVVYLNVSDIEPKPNQPRRTFDQMSLQSLADSISANGVIQPILVRPSGGGFYQIIAGERRWRASKMAGKTTIPAIIMEADELKAAQYALIENIQRENLNPFEEADAYRMLMEEYSLTQEEISASVGKSRSAIANSLRLLDLPPEVLDMLRSSELTAGHGRALLGLRDRSAMYTLAKKAAQRNLSVREVETAVKNANKNYEENGVKMPTLQPQSFSEMGVDYVAELEKRCTEKLGRSVHVVRARNRKLLQVEYTDDSDLEDLLKKLCGNNIFDDNI
jgi:ParB family chromosome partitioning protein